MQSAIRVNVRIRQATRSPCEQGGVLDGASSEKGSMTVFPANSRSYSSYSWRSRFAVHVTRFCLNRFAPWRLGAKLFGRGDLALRSMWSSVSLVSNCTRSRKPVPALCLVTPQRDDAWRHLRWHGADRATPLSRIVDSIDSSHASMTRPSAMSGTISHHEVADV